MWERRSADRKFRYERSTQGQDLLRETRILFRINDVNARPEHRHSLAFGSNGAAMTSRVHTSCHSADNHQAMRGQITRQSLGHSRAVGCRMARSYQGNAWLRNYFHLPAHVQH